MYTQKPVVRQITIFNVGSNDLWQRAVVQKRAICDVIATMQRQLEEQDQRLKNQSQQLEEQDQRIGVQEDRLTQKEEEITYLKNRLLILEVSGD